MLLSFLLILVLNLFSYHSYTLKRGSILKRSIDVYADICYSICKSTNVLKSAASDWLESKELQSEEMKIKILSDGTCVAKVAVKTGEVLATLPSGLCLTTAAAERKFGSVLNSARLRTGDLGMLALFLLAERSAPAQSKFYAYINSLPGSSLAENTVESMKDPQSIPGPLGWLSADREQLALSTTRDTKAQFAAIDTDIQSFLQSPSVAGLFPSGALTAKSLTWAFATVKARAVYIDGFPLLIPGIDYISFDPLAENEPALASAGMFGGKVVRVKADRDYKPGDRVYMSYGLKSSAECVEDHGFCPVIEPLDDACCEISVAVEPVDKYAEDKIEILERAGFRREIRFDLEARADTDLDAGLIRALRLKLIDGRDSFILEPCFSRTVFEILALPFSRANEVRVYEWLRDSCRSLLGRINQGAGDGRLGESDTAYLASPSAAALIRSRDYDNQSPQLALAMLRSQERAALEATIRRAEGELRVLQGLDMREYYQERRLKELDLLRPLDDSEIRDGSATDDDYDLN